MLECLIQRRSNQLWALKVKKDKNKGLAPWNAAPDTSRSEPRRPTESDADKAIESSRQAKRSAKRRFVRIGVCVRERVERLKKVNAPFYSRPILGILDLNFGILLNGSVSCTAFRRRGRSMQLLLLLSGSETINVRAELDNLAEEIAGFLLPVCHCLGVVGVT